MSTRIWKDYWTEGSPRLPEAAESGTATLRHAILRIFSREQGYLNAKARRLMFDGEPDGWLRYQRDEAGAVCLHAVTANAGYRVSRSGHVNVLPLTRISADLVGTTYRLEPDPEDPKRLLFVGRA